MGLGSYGWLSWKEKRKVAIKAAEKKCGAISFCRIWKCCFRSDSYSNSHLENLTLTANPENDSEKNVCIEVPAIRGKKDMEDMDVKSRRTSKVSQSNCKEYSPRHQTVEICRSTEKEMQEYNYGSNATFGATWQFTRTGWHSNSN